MEDSKKSVSEIFAVSDRKIGVLNGARRFEVKARTAASKTIEVEVDKPLGLTDAWTEARRRSCHHC